MFLIPLSPGRFLRLASLSLLAGVALASFLPERFFQPLWPWFLILAIISIATIFSPKKYLFWPLFGLFFILGIWRYGLAIGSSQIAIDLPNGNYEGQAEIITEPRWVASGQELIVRLLDNPNLAEVSIKTGFQQNFQIGQTIWLSCRLRKTVASESYLKSRNLASTCYQADIAIQATKQNWLTRLRQTLGESINNSLTEPAGGLANAMLFGQRQDLSPELMKAFASSGLGHLIAISGMNISLLIWLVMILALACGLKRRVAYYWMLIIIALFVLLVGGSASVVRAAIMGILVISASQIGRLSNPTHILVVSAGLMVAWNPTWLIFDLGFQLSFLAILGLGWFYPGLSVLFDKLVDKCPKWSRKIIDPIGLMAIATISAQMLTLPLLAWRFGYLSMVSVPANILAVWTMPVFMVAGLAATALTLLLPAGGLIFWLPVGLLLTYLIKLCYFFSGLPWAIWQISDIWLYLLWLIYIPELLLARYLIKIAKNSDKVQFL